MSEPGGARRRRRPVLLLATLLALLGVAQLVAVRTTDGPAPTQPLVGAVRGSAVRPDPAVQRQQAVQALLTARADAVLHHDRAAFLATVWPGAPDFVRRQGELFDHLAPVPLSAWDYALDPASSRPDDLKLDQRYGAGRWWSPDVVLHYVLTDFDGEPTAAPQALTFVHDGDRWLLASDDDFASQGSASARALWDFGPVVIHRGAHTLALGHPGSETLLTQLTGVLDASVPRVTSVWGTDWPQRVVVLVPNDQTELSSIVGGSIDLSRIAAVATAELTEEDKGYHPVGDRIGVNPPNFAKLGTLGRQVVLTHETTHVASRASTGPDTPTWLVEGLADYVGYLGVPVPVTTAARDLRDEVRAGRAPTGLPEDAAFDGGDADLSSAYEGSWLAVRLLVQTYGQDAALRFYRAVGASRGRGEAAALDAAFADVLHTSTAAFTAAWRSYLGKTLA